MSLPAAKGRLLGATSREIVERAVKISKKLKETKEKNFFDIATMKARDGVGMLFKHKQWQADCYYTITKVKVQPDGRHGQAWGILTWNGKEITKETMIHGLAKRGLWKYIPEHKIEQRKYLLAQHQYLQEHLLKVKQQNEKYASEQQ